MRRGTAFVALTGAAITQASSRNMQQIPLLVNSAISSRFSGYFGDMVELRDVGLFPAKTSSTLHARCNHVAPSEVLTLLGLYKWVSKA